MNARPGTAGLRPAIVGGAGETPALPGLTRRTFLKQFAGGLAVLWLADRTDLFGQAESGGTGRMIVSTVNVNLRAEAENLGPTDRFTLNCPPAVARERLEQLAEWGFDTVIVTRLNYAAEDWPEDDLRELAALWPR